MISKSQFTTPIYTNKKNKYKRNVMKKKNSKNIIEKAVEVVNNLKASAETSEVKGQGLTAIKALETSIRKIGKLEKEVIALKDKLRAKKSELNEERILMQELAQVEKKMLKNKPSKKEKAKKKDKKQKVEEEQILEKA